VSGILLDVNVLVALFWPAHEHHEDAQRWFARKARQGWVTTPVTQTGFIRIVSNPAFSKDAISPRQAIQFLDANLRHEHHRFWAGSESVPKVLGVLAERIAGYRQVTDAYLLGLAVLYEGKLATFDRGMAELAGSAAVRAGIVELISTR